MAHSRDRGKKEKKKAPKQDKKQKGIAPHLERSREQSNGTVREIQRHLDDLSKRQQQE
jgi:hypothetical protein